MGTRSAHRSIFCERNYKPKVEGSGGQRGKLLEMQIAKPASWPGARYPLYCLVASGDRPAVLFRFIIDFERINMELKVLSGEPDRRMIALGGRWDRLVPRHDVMSEGPGENSRPSPAFENDVSHAEFGRIDWAAAAPSWTSLVAGIVLPAVAVIAFVALIELTLCWAFERWIGHLWTLPLWLVATMMLPLSLFGAIIFARLSLQISGVSSTVTKSKEIL